MAHKYEKRTGTRHDVSWNAECGVAHGFAMGLIRDISSRGMFFQPVTELLGTPTWETGDVPLLLRPGDKISVSYTLERSQGEVTVPATVKWVGTSKKHGEYGVGLELTRDDNDDS
ncbi:MAG: hypothetical protein A2289_08190 [Deltaproteobacteria bacterium RIFOXYA12_FULL_58_15]|nr:MAG: hypothetical protein A2289_08190 [Deltaproteobacteria bacterium RIFOXYA12_FULL_58_15]OGR14531.1 MAG: hypothetical protein A2341_19565 [Deltaproteobacteria bacterium RIFOXYB12_FULL_58_9]